MVNLSELYGQISALASLENTFLAGELKLTVEFPALKEQTYVSISELPKNSLIVHEWEYDGKNNLTQGYLFYIDADSQMTSVWRITPINQSYLVLKFQLESWELENVALLDGEESGEVDWTDDDFEYLVLYRHPDGPTFDLLNWTTDSWKTLVEGLL
jgi:hypothetical protein